MLESSEAITKVYRRNNYWHVETNGHGFAFPAKYTKGKRAPKVGDQIICHTERGSTVRGVTLRGELLYYRTDEELAVEHEQWKEKYRQEKLSKFKKERRKLNEQYDSLPVEFQRRISWFRAHNPDFRAESEAYEMSCCVDAVLIANTLKTAKAIERFKKASYKKQQTMVPGMYDGHSGNSFSTAVHLAELYVRDPLLVIAAHGALAPLVGCEDYGCAHPRPADVMAALEKED